LLGGLVSRKINGKKINKAPANLEYSKEARCRYHWGPNISAIILSCGQQCIRSIYEGSYLKALKLYFFASSCAKSS